MTDPTPDQPTSVPIIPDPKTTVVGTDGGDHLYYDLDSLVHTLLAALVPKALMARLSDDPTEIARCQGAKWVIDSIALSRDSLRDQMKAEAMFALPDAVDPFDSPGGGDSE